MWPNAKPQPPPGCTAFGDEVTQEAKQPFVDRKGWKAPRSGAFPVWPRNPFLHVNLRYRRDLIIERVKQQVSDTQVASIDFLNRQPLGDFAEVVSWISFVSTEIGTKPTCEVLKSHLVAGGRPGKEHPLIGGLLDRPSYL